jgi:hypothetical protein
MNGNAEQTAEQIEARLSQDRDLQQEWLRQDGLIYAGLIAGCVALAQPLLTAPSLDLPAAIAVVAFAVAIPLLAALLMVTQHEAFRRRRADVPLVMIAKGLAQGAAVVGLVAAFWHILWVAGLALLVSALVGLGVHSISFTRLEGLDASPRSET